MMQIIRYVTAFNKLLFFDSFIQAIVEIFETKISNGFFINGFIRIKSQPTVVSTFASPHEPTPKPKARKRASTFPAQVTAFQDGFRIAHAK